MNTTSAPSPARPWYREPMVWMVIGLPTFVVGAAIATLVIAIRAGGTDAYPAAVRRTAQVQVEDLAADRAAIALGIAGTLAIDADTGAVRVALENVPSSTVRIRLNLIHPARADGDMELMLVRSGDAFLGRLETPAVQVWTVQASDAQGAWRVTGRFEPGAGTVALAPALSEGS